MITQNPMDNQSRGVGFIVGWWCKTFTSTLNSTLSKIKPPLLENG